MSAIETFTGNNGRLSSKRIIGTCCIAFSMFIVVFSFVKSGFMDVPPNIQVVSLQYLITGAGMITAGVVEGFTSDTRRYIREQEGKKEEQ